MASSLPLALRIGERPPAVAVDAAFALSPYGLLAVMTLAGVADVYIPRSLLGPLDNHEAYRRNPAGLASPAWGLSSAELSEMAENLGLWRRAWHFGRLASRVHWVGDVSFESMPAEREGTGLKTRFEWCAAAFENSFGDLLDLAFPLDACARDALALAGAILPDPVVLLTAGGGEAGPRLCRLLASAGLATAGDLRGGEDLSRVRLAQASPVLRAANGTLVEVLVPGAMALPEGWSAEQDWEGEEEALLAWDVWANARLIWRDCGKEDVPAAPTPIRDHAA